MNIRKDIDYKFLLDRIYSNTIGTETINWD